jgi:hypothetical protein
MPTPLVAGAVISGAASVLGGIFGMSAAKKRERAAAAEKRRLTKELTRLENTRQDVINPYDNMQDLSSQMTNAFDDIGVATQAAEMQIEQTDVALANTLDSMRATGVGGGGATALAQAALQSKQGVSASIEQQEASNQKLRAQGAQQQQRMQMQEKQRMQQGEAAGRTFEFNATEKREVAKMDRVAGQIDGAAAREVQAQSDRTGAFTGMISGLASTAGSFMSATGQIEAAKAANAKGGAANVFSNLNLGDIGTSFTPPTSSFLTSSGSGGTSSGGSFAIPPGAHDNLMYK